MPVAQGMSEITQPPVEIAIAGVGASDSEDPLNRASSNLGAYWE